MSENSIEFSLSNSEQRDSWLNSSHRTLDADTTLKKNPMNTLSLNNTYMEELPIAHHKYICSSTKSGYHLWEVY